MVLKNGFDHCSHLDNLLQKPQRYLHHRETFISIPPGVNLGKKPAILPISVDTEKNEKVIAQTENQIEEKIKEINPNNIAEKPMEVENTPLFNEFYSKYTSRKLTEVTH